MYAEKEGKGRVGAKMVHSCTHHTCAHIHVYTGVHVHVQVGDVHQVTCNCNVYTQASLDCIHVQSCTDMYIC